MTLSFTSANSATFAVGHLDTFHVTTSGAPAPNISASGTLPYGVSFSNGVLSGTPAGGTGGTYPIMFTAANTDGSANQSFTLTVAGEKTAYATATPATKKPEPIGESTFVVTGLVPNHTIKAGSLFKPSTYFNPTPLPPYPAQAPYPSTPAEDEYTITADALVDEKGVAEITVTPFFRLALGEHVTISYSPTLGPFRMYNTNNYSQPELDKMNAEFVRLGGDTIDEETDPGKFNALKADVLRDHVGSIGGWHYR